MLGRVLLTVAALLLGGTAAFHATGGPQVADWLGGERGAVLLMLWYVPTVDWAVVGIAWLIIAWRGNRSWAPLALVLALVPAGAAAMVAVTVGPEFLGLWLLAGAALLGCLGAAALPKRAT